MTKKAVAVAGVITAVMQVVLAVQHVADALDASHPAKWCAWCP